MDLKEIKALYKFFKNTDLVELETEGKSGRIIFKRGGGPPVERVQVAPAMEVPVAAPAVSEPKKAEPAPPPDENIKIVPRLWSAPFIARQARRLRPLLRWGTWLRRGSRSVLSRR